MFATLYSLDAWKLRMWGRERKFHRDFEQPSIDKVNRPLETVRERAAQISRLIVLGKPQIIKKIFDKNKNALRSVSAG